MIDKLSNEEKKEVREEIKKEMHRKAICKAVELKNEYKKQVSAAIITAFGLVIALVWKDVITVLMPSISAPGLLEDYPFLAHLYTAVIVTGFAVIGIFLISSWAKPKIVCAG